MFYITLAILIIIVYICLYGLVNRVCRCIEHCATAKTYSQALSASEKKVEAGSEKEEE